MIVVVFRNRLRAEVDAEYGPRAEQILELARQQPGFVSFRAYTADDGERLALSEFDTLENAEAWGRHAEHLIAQQQGRDTFYTEYTLQICELVRDSLFPPAR